VAGYTITITPNDQTGAQTTIRVDTTSGSARVTELTVRSAGGDGLPPYQLPAVNIEQLIAALSPVQSAIASLPSTPAAAAPAVSAPAGRGRARAKRAGRKEPAKKATARTRRSRTEQTTARETAGGRRAYRRMPEPEEVAELYRSAGSATAVAEHYGVPRHTASGWVRRLRSQGLLDAA
jgi:hypothetical protein